MEKAEIRPARLSDAEAIARLCSDDLGYACTASFVRRKLAAALENPCARVFVAEAGGAVEAWARETGACGVRLNSGMKKYKSTGS